MPWHKSHNQRMSDSSYYDMVCDDCGATDGSGHEHLMSGPCGMPEITADQFRRAYKIPGHMVADVAALRKVFDKETLYKLVYNGDTFGNKWIEFGILIGQVSYKPGWYFRAGIENGRMWFQVGVTDEAEISFDPIEGKKVPWRGAKHYLSPHMCRNEIITGVKHAIDRAEMHEVNEWFRYKGKSIYNPHLDPDALVEVAKYAKNFDTRVNAMTMEDPS